MLLSTRHRPVPGSQVSARSCLEASERPAGPVAPQHGPALHGMALHGMPCLHPAQMRCAVPCCAVPCCAVLCSVLCCRQLGINAIYSGHDHNNDYSGKLEGVRVAYGRKSGYGSYGPPAGWLRGARVIELRQGQGAAASATWIRGEDGSKIIKSASGQSKGEPQMECAF